MCKLKIKNFSTRLRLLRQANQVPVKYMSVLFKSKPDTIMCWEKERYSPCACKIEKICRGAVPITYFTQENYEPYYLRRLSKVFKKLKLEEPNGASA